MYPEIEPTPTLPEALMTSRLARNPLVRAAGYILRRLLVILLTIVVGVFITVVIANRLGMLDAIARSQVDNHIRSLMWSGLQTAEIEVRRHELETAAGVYLPFWPKHLLYTYRALMLNWGDVTDQKSFGMWLMTSSGMIDNTYDSRTIILARLPNTLLLSGTAYLLLMLIGIPLALYLSQHEGGWLDRLNAVLTPISSVPSWVIGILLVMIFAVQLKWLPGAKMIDAPPPATTAETIWQVARHLVLPAASILLSLIFQLVNNWRTFLLIYSEEDYVDLARAKGLKARAIRVRYILRPVLPYLLTGLALTLAGFWQTITALEFFFDWPGIGKLFVAALPNFHGESMYRGEMSIVVNIVVLFAYLLGLTVFVLDILYVLVDPRLRLGGDNQTLFPPRQAARAGGLRAWLQAIGERRARPREKRKAPTLAALLRAWHENMRQANTSLQHIQHEIARSPGAVAGLAMIALLVTASLAVVIFLPYKSIGRQWRTSAVTANPTRAKLALPVWVNWFRQNDLPKTIILDSRDGGARKQFTQTSTDTSEVELEYTFDYPYREFPSEMSLYINAAYTEKKPFLMATWITADGREVELKNFSGATEMTYSLSENVIFQRELKAHPVWKEWFVTSGNYPTPAFYLLLADPVSGQPQAQPGLYTLRVKAVFFEPSGDLNAKLAVLGKVEGWAGTDNMRRDLAVPLLWGLPLALVVGGVGAIATTLLSLLIAAAGAWFGGPLDALIQRAVEANLILPVLAIGVLFAAYYGFNLWAILVLMVALNVLGSPTKSFRAAFLQVKTAEYIEAARVYGASNWRIIRNYLIPRILPVIIPQIIILIPNFVFLEATLAIFNISDPRYPTWGQVIYSGLRYGAAYGSRYWVLEPIGLMLLTGLAFILLGYALNRILNPRLRET